MKEVKYFRFVYSKIPQEGLILTVELKFRPYHEQKIRTAIALFYQEVLLSGRGETS